MKTLKQQFKHTLTIFFGLSVVCNLYAQPVEQRVKIIVAPDRADWTYKANEKIKFSVTVLKDGNPLKNIKIIYEYGLEKMMPLKKDSMLLPNGSTTIEAGFLKTPGFLRCAVQVRDDGKAYRNFATAGVDPFQIKPTVTMPEDFVAFWEKAKSDAALVPVDAKMTLLPERCTEMVNVYHVNLQNYRVGSRLYGILCVPKKEGKYPAVLRVPGAGVRAYSGDIGLAEKGIITFEIGIHGIPVNMDASVYTDLGASALQQYFYYNLDHKDRYYYKRVYMGCVRANDFLVSLPQYDGEHLGVTGGSQGGALSIITAALDTRVKFLAAYYPALSDLTGYLHERAGGWPHIFERNNLSYHNTKEKIETVRYYDVVNFARMLKVPGYYSWGYNDEVCPPTSMYAAYNVIEAPKELHLELETGHWIYPEQREKMNQWIVKMSGKK